MAENLPNLPTGAVPPRPTEAAKVQPKKETVRINLPPKPTAAPTIKLPTPAAAAAPTQTPAPSAATGAPAAPATGPATAAAGPAQRPVSAAAPRAPMVSRPPIAGPGVSSTDQILALVAAVVSILALVRLLFL